jgi:hypothetical protein
MIAKYNGPDTEKQEILTLMETMALASALLRLRKRDREQEEECWRIASELDRFRRFIDTNKGRVDEEDEDRDTPIDMGFDWEGDDDTEVEYVPQSPVKHLFIGEDEKPFECQCGCSMFRMLDADIFECNECMTQYETNVKRRHNPNAV